MRKLLKSLLLSILLTPLVVGLSAGVASAHVLKQDNGITGVLHIPPEDNPLAGQPTELDVSFDSVGNVFNITHCDCKVVIKNNTTTLQTVALGPIASGAELDAKAVVQFPAIGVYDVVIGGTAQDHSFHKFTLDYVVRVASSVNATAPVKTQSQDILILSIGSLGVLAVVGYMSISSGGRYRRAAVKSSNKKG